MTKSKYLKDAPRNPAMEVALQNAFSKHLHGRGEECLHELSDKLPTNPHGSIEWTCKKCGAVYE